jgi:hypothetical protein
MTSIVKGAEDDGELDEGLLDNVQQAGECFIRW